MSKTALKKELSGFTKEQLIEVVLDLYSERKDVRDYFNFFLNPDSEKLAEKYRRLIDKEFGRSKWSRSKARISVIRKLLKEFRSFHPDSKYIHLIYVQTIYLGLYYEDTLYLIHCAMEYASLWMNIWSTLMVMAVFMMGYAILTP